MAEQPSRQAASRLLSDVSESTRLITCILPKGRARALQDALVEDHGIYSGHFHYARGVGRESHIRDRGIGEQQEREVFEVLVERERADEIFDYIFSHAKMAEPHGGMIYMAVLPRATVMAMPEIPEEGD